MDDGKVDKKEKRIKGYVIKRCLIFNNYSECLNRKKENIKISTKL